MHLYTNLVAAAMEGAARPIGTKIGHFQMPKDTCGRLEMESDLLTLQLSDNLLYQLSHGSFSGQTGHSRTPHKCIDNHRVHLSFL